MPLQNIQLCHMDPIDRAAGTFSVTAHSDAGDQFATFRCSSERAARDLRNAIRENADTLHAARDYRERHATRRRPLTDGQITDMVATWNDTAGSSMADLIRAVEAAHGITADTTRLALPSTAGA